MDAEVAIANCLRHFWINNLATIPAVTPFEDIPDDEDRDRDYFFLTSLPHVLQFFKHTSTGRAGIKPENDRFIHPFGLSTRFPFVPKRRTTLLWFQICAIG